MKLGIHDVQHIIGQIKRASPPTTKETHKLINNLAILLEKNTNKIESPLEAVLTAQLEKLNEYFLDLCFLRKEILMRYSREYAEEVNGVLATLKENQTKASKETAIDRVTMEWSLNSESSYSSRMTQDIFGKLHKAKSIIEDAIGQNMPLIQDMDPDGCLESYFLNV
ncbi:hypothetical protein PAEPH01_0601 [Pancytospora epiphaga]|nr:hypothetical protein PAEPH01_0601 [Pancytospora epiphaga]